MFGGFGGTSMGHENPGMMPAWVWPSVKTIMPSPASIGPSNAMNMFVMTLMTLENISNSMNVFTMMDIKAVRFWTKAYRLGKHLDKSYL